MIKVIAKASIFSPTINETNIAIITARGGSKRIPKKNIKLLLPPVISESINILHIITAKERNKIKRQSAEMEEIFANHII